MQTLRPYSHTSNVGLVLQGPEIFPSTLMQQDLDWEILAQILAYLFPNGTRSIWEFTLYLLHYCYKYTCYSSCQGSFWPCLYKPSPEKGLITCASYCPIYRALNHLTYSMLLHSLLIQLPSHCHHSQISQMISGTLHKLMNTPFLQLIDDNKFFTWLFLSHLWLQWNSPMNYQLFLNIGFYLWHRTEL